MTNKTGTKNNVISRSDVRLVAAPAMMDCATVTDGKPAQAMAVVPLLDGDRVAGFEVRCGCGASTIVECIDEDTPLTEDPQS